MFNSKRRCFIENKCWKCCIKVVYNLQEWYPWTVCLAVLYFYAGRGKSLDSEMKCCVQNKNVVSTPFFIK